MHTDHLKMTLAAVWILIVALAGYLSGVTSVVSWIVMTALALGPPLVMLKLWRVPQPSMSESIRDVLR